MSPDDPRHGTVRGHVAHQREGGDYCEPCIRAKSIYDKRRGWDALNGRSYTVPALGARRRLQALQAIGWSRQRIAEAAGWGTTGALNYLMRNETITRSTHERLAETFERLAMKRPPDEMAARRARTWARRHGYAPPLAWDDIDDPHAEPTGIRGKAEPKRTWIDPIVVNELIAGRTVDSTPAEKTEAMRRWLASGKSARSLEVRHGWHSGRYMPRREEASA